MLEITTYWKGDVLSVVHAERCASTRELGIPWDVPLEHGETRAGPLVVRARAVEQAAPLPRTRSRTDLPLALAIAVLLHSSFLGLGSWSYRMAPPIEDAEMLRSWISNERFIVHGLPEREDAKATLPSDVPSSSPGKSGPAPDPRPHEQGRPESRSDIIITKEDASKFGMIGLLGLLGTSEGTATDWGPSVAAISLFDRDIGGDIPAPSFGSIAIGEGGGGMGEGIGLGSIGGWGYRHAPKLHVHEPMVASGLASITVTCKNPVYVETIRRIVRANMGRFRACYEPALARTPTLEGRVQVKFVIERTGLVSTAVDDGSTLPDKGVTQCIVNAFESLAFPEHDGIGYVRYPLQLAPNEI